ncbi:MAG: nitroreductase family protein, partial [Candidatus Nanohaloarchaeota archaeon QJJ-9]|nr:nitroreductase family protein [Candidatus Nanohaloarchaeota archaeon QJJ-9]
LMASSLGIGSAWVGAFEEEKVKDLLDIHKRLRPFAIITLGHPKERPEQPNKHRITDVTYMNEYGNKTHALYDKVVWEGMKEYSRRAKNKVKEKLKD